MHKSKREKVIKGRAVGTKKGRKMTNQTNRAEALANITGGKPEWYSTHRQISRSEGLAGVCWDGVAGSYKPADLGRPVKTGSGSWGRQMHGSTAIAAMTRAECEAAGLVPGPAND